MYTEVVFLKSSLWDQTSHYTKVYQAQNRLPYFVFYPFRGLLHRSFCAIFSSTYTPWYIGTYNSFL